MSKDLDEVLVGLKIRHTWQPNMSKTEYGYGYFDGLQAAIDYIEDYIEAEELVSA